MPFTTYSELRTAVADHMARDDLTTFIPDFITLFEAEACRKMRVRLAETTSTVTPSSGAGTLPTDILSIRRVTWMGDTRSDLTYLHPSYFDGLYPTRAAGTPANYKTEGSTITVGPSDDTDLEIDYFQRTPAVSGTLNWLFTKHPDAYLNGTLHEGYSFIKDVEKALLYKAKRDEILRDIVLVDFNERSPMQMRVWGATP